MRYLKFYGYYLLWLAYYVFCFLLITLLNLQSNPSLFINILVVILPLLAVGSPFMMTEILIGRFYHGQAVASKEDKKLHAKQWGWKIAIFMVVYIIGSVSGMIIAKKGMTTLVPIVFISYNICLIISLFTVNFKVESEITL